MGTQGGVVMLLPVEVLSAAGCRALCFVTKSLENGPRDSIVSGVPKGQW